ncbi:MAG: magnesium transporter [Hyphomicrobiaceae bacterium]|nr:MAG: magnesium transporter [Hyphomicrobiaceae bacterium]
MAALPANATISRSVNDEAPPAQSVAHYLVKAVPTAGADERAGTVRERLVGRRYEDASHVFLVTDGRLAGFASIADVLAAPSTTPLAEIATDINSHLVTPATDREEAASVAIHADLSVLGVCDADGRFIGAVPASALISILRDEHLEDLHHMVGIMGRSEAAQAALAAPPHRRALYRLPWLLVGMAGSALATMTMARFEAALAAHIAVAFFIPAIVYLADAVGTQSEAVAVRGLSLTSADLAPLLVGEVGTGILIGVALGTLAYPMVWLAFGSAALAATVAIALTTASSVATAIGFALPWVFARLGYDPALGSGPLGTVVQDVLSLLIYFWIASMLVF